MPRLNTSTYLHHHHQLKELWLIEPECVLVPKPHRPLALHRNFQFASGKTEAELLGHHRNLQALDPSLPQRAGRAYARLLRGERAEVEHTEVHNGRRVSVRSIMWPEPDIKMLAKVFITMALDQLRNAGHDRAA